MVAKGPQVTSDAATQPRRVDKPWGYELIWAHTDRYVGKLLKINAGQALSYQFHQIKDETIYVLSGTLRLHYSEDDSPAQVIELGPGSVFRIRTGLRHRFEATGDVEVLEASTPELDDVVRIEDRYGRAPQHSS